MKCPNCGNEVSANHKFCTRCGSKLENIIKDNDLSQTEVINKINKNKKNIIIAALIILLSSFLIVVIVTVFLFKTKVDSDEVATYKSVKPIEQSQIENMTSRSLVELAIQQDKDMFEFVKSSFNGNPDKLFGVFYKNLVGFVNNIDIDDLIIDTIESNDDIQYVLSPKTDIFKFQIENWSSIFINDEYLYKRYSKYLNKVWQEYLELLANSKEADLYQNCLVESTDIVNEIILWQKFLSENSNFIMNNSIKNTIKFLVECIIYRSDSDYTFDIENNNILSNDAKKGYEDFLKRVDKSTQEYKVVKSCYGTLEKNNFKANSEFYKIIYDYTGDEYYKRLFENKIIMEEEIKQEQEKVAKEHKIINQYKNLKYNKEELYRLYQEAETDWEEHKYDKDENGILIHNGSGSYSIYITDYINKKTAEFTQILNLMFEYCSIIKENEGSVSVRDCYLNEISKETK